MSVVMSLEFSAKLRAGASWSALSYHSRLKTTLMTHHYNSGTFSTPQLLGTDSRLGTKNNAHNSPLQLRHVLETALAHDRLMTRHCLHSEEVAEFDEQVVG
jgi:hypothetical protein